MEQGQSTGGTVLVLGAAVWSGGRASPALARRVARGVAVWQCEGAQILVVSGGVGRIPPTEAQVGVDLARQAGVPDHALIEEPRARSTVENLSRTMALFPEGLPQPVYVVSDWYHLPRAWAVARVLGLRVRGRAVARRPQTRMIPRQMLQVLREVVALVPTLVAAYRQRS